MNRIGLESLTIFFFSMVCVSFGRRPPRQESFLLFIKVVVISMNMQFAVIDSCGSKSLHTT